MSHRPFREAREVVHKLGLKSKEEWDVYCKSGKKPPDIPNSPHSVPAYKKEWKGFGDWLGTGRIANQDRVYRPFDEAREFVHKLGLKDRNEWYNYCKSGKKPQDIPITADKSYKKEWKGWGDWLGTGRIASFKMVYLSFVEAREFVHKLGLKNKHDWIEYCKSGNKPQEIPNAPWRVYKSKWKSLGDWLGTEVRPFAEAREFVHKLGLGSIEKWEEYCKSGKKPQDIPSNPRKSFRDNWKGWGDWLGTDAVEVSGKLYRPFDEAREFVHKLKLRSVEEWKEYCKSGKKPPDIPNSPHSVPAYKKEWKGFGDWLGTGRTREHRPFFEARKLVHSLGLKDRDEWKEYCKSGKKPPDIPSAPFQVSSYKTEWKGWADWLGTEVRPFAEARDFVRTLGLKSRDEWKEYCKSGKKPHNIPIYPDDALSYKTEWKGWADWLGTEFWPFEKAREYVHRLGLKNKEDWQDWCKSGKRPEYIPSTPDDTYKNKGWIDWYDWLDTEETIWSVKRVKELLRDLIKDNLIYEADDIILYNILYTRGLLNLRDRDRHGQFFKNLLKAVKTPEGRELVEKYANSDSETPPDLSGNGVSPDEELATASYQDIEESGQTNPLDSGPTKSVEQIFKEAHRLESYVEDIESMQFHVSHYVQQLWQNAFLNEEEAVSKIRLNGNEYHDAISKTFLLEYEGAKSIKSPQGYAFPKGKPNLMQQLVAYKVKTNRRFGNFSKTGTGKTLSAVLASRVVDSHMTVIICPNAVVKQWGEDIEQIFPSSVVKLRKDAFFEKRDENKHKYLVINYDLFSQPHSANWILELTKQKIDFVILDEIHFTKKRENIAESKRHEKIKGLMTYVAENKNVYVLGMSATPVINELQEGISLLELITGKIYDDVSNRATTQNAVKLHEKLALNSIRKIPDKIDYDINTIEVKQDVTKVNFDVKELKRNPLKLEQLGLDAKIPEIINHIQGKTIIYTEYVDAIVDKIKRAIEEAGYTCAKFTGEDHSGLTRFKEDEKLQVLVASRPVSTGVDGLQDVCHNLIISCLPWTSAGFDQLTGRIIRQGQNNPVNINFIKAKLFAEGRGELQYDEKKWKMILYKRSIADCAVDGIVPEKSMLDRKQVQMEAIRWYERIARGEISIIERRHLDVRLTPVDIASLPANQQQNLYRSLGDFSEMNKVFNTSNSDTMHEKIKQDPQYLIQYHEKLDETRKLWTIDPVKVIANKINNLPIPDRIIAKMVIGDFGCGRAKLAELLNNKVYNFDHHTILGENVIECDMKRTLLKKETLDVAVFSLSLMGQNWTEYIAEAKRCLRKRGMLMIAETTKSLSARLSGLKDEITKQGFEIRSEKQEGDFTFIEAMKL